MYLGAEIGATHHSVGGVAASQHLTAAPNLMPMEPQQADTVTSSQRHPHHHNHHSAMTPSRKRKASFTDASDADDDLLGDEAGGKMPRSAEDSCKKQNHSEIEKRRRDKMNTYITELSKMVPMCHAMSRKLDKLTVLRMAVQHLKTIRGAVHSYTEGHYKPAFLTDEELKHLILQAAEGFLFVVGCDRGRILYVSESVSQVLNYSQGDLLGQSWFDILHPKDVAKVKEQLSSSDLSPRERLIDAKTMLPVKTDMPQGVSRLCPGARRSFFCRMKCKASSQVKEEVDTTSNGNSNPACHRRKKSQNSDRRYSVIQCTGYLKSWAPAKMGLEEPDSEDGESASHLSCLVAVGRIQPPPPSVGHHPNPSQAPPNLRSIEFVSRHALDGKFLFVDQRATLVLGFLPQELLGTSMYEYYCPDDVSHLAEAHKAALQSTDRVTTQGYRFRSKDGSYVRMQSEWRAFSNPWTRDVEYLVAKNCLLRITNGQQPEQQQLTPLVPANLDNFFCDNIGKRKKIFVANGSPGGREITRVISSHVEASKIGRQIAEEALDTRRRTVPSESPSISNSPSSPGFELGQSSLQLIGNGGESYQRNNALTRQSSHSVTLCNEEKDEEELLLRDMMAPSATVVVPQASPPNGQSPSANSTTTATPPQHHSNASNDGNDEAAMAVIMSLLEADAGLGGPVDFSGLPWPLP
ncbi:protein cycle isoform X3 [Neocloeon triangulifer]|nr:protein cycle isoform X3 [Neocloeon triangulifer]